MELSYLLSDFVNRIKNTKDDNMKYFIIDEYRALIDNYIVNFTGDYKDKCKLLKYQDAISQTLYNYVIDIIIKNIIPKNNNTAVKTMILTVLKN